MIYCSQSYDKTAERFDFTDIGSTLKEIEKKLIEFVETYHKQEKMIESSTIPATTILMSIKEFTQELQLKASELKNIKEKLDSVRNDEERAKKHLLKLHLIMNEIQVKIRKHRLPTISTQYERGVKTAPEKIRSIEDLLLESQLKVSILNAT